MIAGSIEIQLMANIARLQRDMDQARQVVTRATDGMERAANAAKTALASIGAGIGLQQIVRLSDEYTKFTAQLRLATQSQREYAQAYADVKRISTTAQADLGATGVLYARIANGTRELGVAQAKVAKITETVNLALKVSGATTQESASAILQLSQAFGSGVLRGQEFNAVNEAAPRLMKALADGMGVPVGALRGMAEEGKITSKIMAEVLPGALDKLREEAKQVQTISGAFTVLKNNVMEFVGTQAQASGAVSALTSGIAMLANNLGLLAGTMLTIGAAKLGSTIATWVADTYKQVAASVALRAATVANMEAEVANTGARIAQLGTTQAMIVISRQDAIAKLASSNANIAIAETAIAAATAAGAQSFALHTLRLATAELAVAEAARVAMLAELAVLGRQQASVSAQVAAAKIAEKAAQDALNASTGAGAVASGLAARAIGFLGGPIGAIITVLGLAATAWAVWGNKAKESSEQAVESYEEAHKRIVKGLDEQIAKNEKLIQLQNLGMTKPEIDRNAPVLAQMEAASKRLSDINTRAGEFASGKSNDDIFFARAQVMKHIVELTADMQKGDATAAAAAAGNTEGLIAIRMRLAGVNKQYLDDLTTLEARRAAGGIGEKEYIALVSKLATEEYKRSDAAKAAASIAGHEKTAYESLVGSIREKIAAGALEMNGYDKLSESQKLTIKLNEDIAAGKIKQGSAHAITAAAMILERKVQEDVIASQKRAADGAEEWEKITKKHGETVAKSIEDGIKEAEKNEELARTFGMTKGAIEQLELARLEEQLAQRASTGLTLDEIETLEKLIAAKKRSTAAAVRLDGMEAAKKAGEDLDKFLDPSKAQTFGEALRTAFGSAGDSITKLTGALQDYGIKQAEINKQRGNAALAYLNGQKTEREYLAKTAELSRRSTQNQMAGYGDMAGAAAGFFDEHSRGYQSLMAVSQVFHAAELAMTMAELVPKAISAVLTQGSGDPYTAFGRMAAMAALVTGLGVAISGVSGGDTTAKDRQAAVGTGSVLGDAKAKSESISKSLDAIDNNTYQGLTVSMGMLDALRAIQNGISGLGNILLHTDGFSTTTPSTQLGAAASFTVGLGDKLTFTSILDKITGGAVGRFSGKVSNAVFGGDVHSIDTGVMLPAMSLGQIASSGALVSQYNDTKTDGGWFHSDEYGTQKNPLGAEVNDQFTKILLGLRDGIGEAGKLLGLSGDAFNAQLNGFVVDLGKISTKDLKPAEVQAALEAALSKAGDDMAKFAVGGLQQFQKAGEGYLETLTRIANDYQTVDVVLQSLGITCNAVGLSSVSARERLIEVSGGLDKFTSNAGQFLKDFYTEQEQAAALKERIDPTLAKYGLSTDGPDAMKAFRDVVKGIDTMTESGAQAYAALMQIAPAFKTVTDAVKEALKVANEAATDALGSVDGALSVVQSVVNRQKALIQEDIDAVSALVTKHKALSESLHSTLDAMKDPTIAKDERLAAQAQIAAALAIAKAGGPLPAADKLKDALSIVSKDVTSQFSTLQEYQRYLYGTKNDIAGLAKLSDSALTTEEKSLEELKAQAKQLDKMLEAAQEEVNLLKGISTTGLTLVQAMEGLRSAILNAQANPVVAATSAVNQAYQSALGRAPDATGLQFWQDKAASGVPVSAIVDAIKTSPEAQIQGLYKSLFNRTSDAAGLEYWQRIAAGGQSMDAIRATFLNSDEYKKLKGIPGFVNGGDHMGGLRWVGELSPELEATGPSRIHSTRDLVSAMRNPSESNAVLAAAVERLTATVERQQAALDQIQRNTKRHADTFEVVTEGGNAMRTVAEPA